MVDVFLICTRRPTHLHEVKTGVEIIGYVCQNTTRSKVVDEPDLAASQRNGEWWIVSQVTNLQFIWLTYSSFDLLFTTGKLLYVETPHEVQELLHSSGLLHRSDAKGNSLILHFYSPFMNWNQALTTWGRPIHPKEGNTNWATTLETTLYQKLRSIHKNRCWVYSSNW